MKAPDNGNQPRRFWILPIVGLMLLGLAACSQANSTPPSVTDTPQQGSPTPTLPPPTATPVPPTPTAVRTPPALPAVFTSDLLKPGVTPQTYINDTCQYLKMRWDPNNSEPGTVVMVIMYHSITEDGNELSPTGEQIHHSTLEITLRHAQEVGFQTINSEQLANFLEHNAKIPKRSLLIIVDDRKRAAYYETHFLPFLEEFKWTITNAWISAPDTSESLYQENAPLVQAGWIDVQAHGVVHNTPITADSSEEYMHSEIEGSAANIEARYGKRPIAYIWPGGGFTRRAIEIARAAGYRLGFTTNPRGPVMFNWVPQASEADPNSPSWIPETPAGDPLMTLPRYWSIDAASRIDEVITIGKQAAAEAKQNKATELEYYDIVCKGITGEIPTATP